MLLNASKRQRREERGGRGVNFYPTLPLTRNRVRSKFGNVMFHVTKFKLLNILVKWRCLHCTWKALFSKIKAFSLLKLFLLFSRVIFFLVQNEYGGTFFLYSNSDNNKNLFSGKSFENSELHTMEWRKGKCIQWAV